jgi:hypothetical protein
MNTTVTGCKDCPMYATHLDGWGGCHCNHPETEGNDLENHDNETVPDWCPLKREEITIKLIG